MQKIIILPMRAGSKGIPDKNEKPFCGVPLYKHILNELLFCKEIDKIIVATDIENILNWINDNKFEKIIAYKRDKENAQDESTTESVIEEVYKKDLIKEDDICILVQATNPFIKAEYIDTALYPLETIISGHSILSASSFNRYLWHKDIWDYPYNYDNLYNEEGTNIQLIRKRRQEMDDYIENGSFYIFSMKKFIETGSRLGNNYLSPKLYIMPDYSYIEIDSIWEWELAEWMYQKLQIKENING